MKILDADFSLEGHFEKVRVLHEVKNGCVLLMISLQHKVCRKIFQCCNFACVA